MPNIKFWSTITRQLNLQNIDYDDILLFKFSIIYRYSRLQNSLSWHNKKVTLTLRVGTVPIFENGYYVDVFPKNEYTLYEKNCGGQAVSW